MACMKQRRSQVCEKLAVQGRALTDLGFPREVLGSLERGPLKGMEVLGVLRGSWDLVTTCNWAYSPSYKWAKL